MTPRKPRRPGAARHAGGARPFRPPWRAIVTAAAVLAVIAFLYHRIDLQAVHAFAARINGLAAFALLTVLPLVGFPVSVLHVAAGIRFGFGLGLALVALALLLQLLASYGLVHLWPGLFARRLDRIRRRIPPGSHVAVCFFTLLLPGVPFFVQNYTLALLGVPLRTYLLCCLPLDVLRALITVGLGGQSTRLTPLRLSILGGYGILLGAASWWAYRRLRRQLADRPPAAGGPTRSG